MALTVALGAVILGEQMVVPYPSEAVQPPAFARQLAAEPGEGTVLVVPFSFEEPRALYWQTIHRRPMIAGYLSRPINDPLLLLPPFQALVNQRDPARYRRCPIRQYWRGRRSPSPRCAGWSWIWPMPSREREPLASFMAEQVEAAPFYADRGFRRLPDARRARRARPAARRADRPWLVRPGAAGRLARPDALARSGRDDPRLEPRRRAGSGDDPLHRLELSPAAAPRKSASMVSVIDTRTIVDLQTVTLSVTLAPGRHQLELRALDSPLRPVDLGLGTDPARSRSAWRV